LLFQNVRREGESMMHGGDPSNVPEEPVSRGQFDAGFTAALLNFNNEAVLYCQGISETIAHEYAMEYTRMLQSRAKGIEVPYPRFPYGLFEPSRNLIRSTLERISEKHFPSK
jgi:hypothetical protein